MYKTDKNSVESLYLLDDLMRFSQPRYVAIKLSEQEYSERYEAYSRSPSFRQDMNKLEYLIKMKNTDDIQDIPSLLVFFCNGQNRLGS